MEVHLDGSLAQCRPSECVHFLRYASNKRCGVLNIFRLYIFSCKPDKVFQNPCEVNSFPFLLMPSLSFLSFRPSPFPSRSPSFLVSLIFLSFYFCSTLAPFPFFPHDALFPSSCLSHCSVAPIISSIYPTPSLFHSPSYPSSKCPKHNLILAIL